MFHSFNSTIVVKPCNFYKDFRKKSTFHLNSPQVFWTRSYHCFSTATRISCGLLVFFFFLSFFRCSNIHMYLIWGIQLNTHTKTISSLIFMRIIWKRSMWFNIQTQHTCTHEVYFSFPNIVCEFNYYATVGFFRLWLQNFSFSYIVDAWPLLTKNFFLIFSLNSLCLDRNKLSNLPNNLKECKNLKTLKVSHNQLETLPKFLLNTMANKRKKENVVSFLNLFYDFEQWKAWIISYKRVRVTTLL